MESCSQLTIMSIAGARPNFMKLASISHAILRHNAKPGQTRKIEHTIIHTGQHYDSKMSEGFFQDLNIPLPDFNLEVGSASHAVQTAEIMKRFEPVLLDKQPDVLLVVGDVNSTIACTLVAAKIEYAGNSRVKRPLIVHVEAGLRSRDRDMPEEINRILTDALSDMLFVTEQSGIDNLASEGVTGGKIEFVGNVMIDTLISHLEKAKSSEVQSQLGLNEPYGLVTLHRPSNVDDRETLERIIRTLIDISDDIRLIFPIHPRTKNQLEKFGLLANLEQKDTIMLTAPYGYLDFLNLVMHARLVLTDSGGIQEETTYLRIPCVTLRENTERPSTVDVGSNYLIGTDTSKLLSTVKSILAGKGKQSVVPPMWDGQAADRIVERILSRAMSE